MNAAPRGDESGETSSPRRAAADPKAGDDNTHNSAPKEERDQFTAKRCLIPREDGLVGGYRRQRPEVYDQFFAAVLGDDGPFSMFATTPDGATRRVEWAHTSNEIRPIVDKLDGWNVWFGVGRRREILPNGQRGGALDVVSIQTLFVDIDVAGPNHKTTKPLPKTVDEAEGLLELIPWQPSAITFTGGGFQVYWFLDEPLEGDEAAVLLTRFGIYAQNRAAGLGWYLDNVFDLSRVLRAPGSTNWKDGAHPRRCELIDFHPERRYSATDLLDEIPHEEPPVEAPPIAPSEPYNGPERPGEHFTRVTPAEVVLEAAGWLHVRTERNGDQQWRHPDATNESSATVFVADGKACIWTDSTRLRQRGSYKAFSLYVELMHEGDASAAASDLRQRGYGAKSSIAGPSTDDRRPFLPADFWDARPELAHIRQAARAFLGSPDAVFGAVIARVAASTDHRGLLPATVGPPAPLNVLVMNAGAPGTGKGVAGATAAELVPFRPSLNHRLREISAGSGEGMVKAFFQKEQIEGDDKKKRLEWVQAFDAVFVNVPEGSSLTPLVARQGQTTAQTLCAAWSGERIGGSAADEDRGHQLAAHTYRLAALLGIQPKKAGPLFDQADTGLPQRLYWFNARASSLPELDEIVEFPGPLPWKPPIIDGRHLTTEVGGFRRAVLGLPSAVHHELRAQARAVRLGEIVVDELDAHRGLLRLKMAGLLAILAGRLDITTEDWELAGVVLDTSDLVRSSVQAELSSMAREKHTAAVRIHADKAAAAAVASDDARTKRFARRVHRYVEEAIGTKGFATRSAIVRRFAQDERQLIPDAIDHAIALDWIRAAGDPDRFTLGEGRPS